MADDWKWTNQVRPGTCALCRHIVGGARTISAKSDWLLLLEATFPQSASLFHKQKLLEIKHSFITAHVQKQVSVNQHFIFIVFSLYRDWIVCKSHNVKAVLTLKMVWGLNIAALAGIALTSGLIFTQLYARVMEYNHRLRVSCLLLCILWH